MQNENRDYLTMQKKQHCSQDRGLVDNAERIHAGRQFSVRLVSRTSRHQNLQHEKQISDSLLQNVETGSRKPVIIITPQRDIGTGTAAVILCKSGTSVPLFILVPTKTFKQNITLSPRTSPADCAQHPEKVDSHVPNVTSGGGTGQLDFIG